VVVDTPAGAVVVPRERATAATGSVVVGVRPEKVRICRAEAGEQLPGNSIGPAPVVDVSFSGVSTQYLVEVPGVGTWTVFAQNLEVAQTAQVGDRVLLNWDPRHTFTLAGDEDLLAGMSPELAEVTG
jgi:spermidine/putrescine transport system ATP-binding protein